MFLRHGINNEVYHVLGSVLCFESLSYSVTQALGISLQIYFNICMVDNREQAFLFQVEVLCYL